MKKKNLWSRLSVYFRAFLIVAALFLAVGLGTLGSVQSVGKSYELPMRQTTDEKEPCVILNVAAPEGYSASKISIREIYLNVGALYTDIGSVATVRIARGTSEESAFSNYTDVKIASVYENVEEGGKTTATSGALYNWIKVSECGSSWSTSGYTLSTYSYFKLTARTSNVVINEIVFAGVNKDLEEKDQVLMLLPATVNENSVLYDRESGQAMNASNKEAALKQASAVADAQHMPSLAQSSFVRFTEEETYSLMSLTEMRFGGSYYAGDVYNGDRVYNSLGTDFLALGTAIFGTSPFGLRFFPMLASFGILVFGFFFVRKLLKSDKAGFIFAMLYTLSGVSLSLGHLGTPLTIGLFFFVASLYTCYLFFADGMKKANFKSAVPVLLSGLFAAAAICVNGAFAVPVLGVVALFAAGLVRQMKKRRVLLDLAIAQAEQEEGGLSAAQDDEAAVSEGRRKAVEIVNEYRYKNSVSAALFAAFLILGTVALSMLGVLPMYFTYVKLYQNPASSVNIMSLVWSAFAGGFRGSNAVTLSSSAWSAFYRIFVGTGERYAVTAAGLLPAVAAVAAGAVGLIFAAVRLACILKKKDRAESDVAELQTVAVLVAGLALSLVTAAFAKGGLAFMLAAYLFAFALAAYAVVRAEKTEGKCSKAVKAVAIVWLCVLIVCFGLFAAFTFSVPLPASFMTKFFG